VKSMTRRLSARQRSFAPYRVVRVLGPLTGVTADGLRAAILRLFRNDPGHPAWCRIDAAGRRWLIDSDPTFTARVADMVVEVDSGGGDPADALGRAVLDAGRPDLPVILAVCEGHLAVRTNHAIGDGGTIWRLIASVVDEAVAARQPVHGRRGVRAPLTRAAIRFFGREPGRVVRMLRAPRQTPPASDGVPAQEWPSPGSVYLRSEVDYLARLRQWRDSHAPGASTGSVFMAAVSGAFAAVGLPVAQSALVIVVDIRRYLPAGTVAEGNLASGQYLEFTDPSDPLEIQESLRAMIQTGRPLTALALTDLRALLGGDPISLRVADPGQPSTSRPSPRLTLSHMPSVPVLDGLPWAGPRSGRQIRTISTPTSPSAITVTSAVDSGQIHVTASFHADVFAPEVVEAALSLACFQPEDALRRGETAYDLGQPVGGGRQVD